MDNIPEDLVYMILLRVPATTLGNAARHVCRSWRSIISDPMFIDHHARSVSDEDAKTLLFQQDILNYNEGLVMYTTGGGLEPIRPKHQFPKDMSLRNTETLVCNGLVLYIRRKDEVLNFYLCNPILNQSITLPSMRTTINGTKHCTSGFGYDSIKKEYKIVVVFEDITVEVDRKSYFYCCTVKPGTENEKKTKYYKCWREVGSIDKELSGQGGLFVDGKLHWFLFPSVFEAKILSFELNTEFLKLTTMSTREDPRFMGRKLLGELKGGKLCVHFNGGLDWSTVWVKKEEDPEIENSEWVEVFDLRNNIHFLTDYCGYWKDDLFVYHGEGDDYVVMKKRNVIVDHVVDFGGFFLSAFVPTLLSLSTTESPDQRKDGDAEDMELD